MNELMIFIWVIGWMYTAGTYIAQIHNDKEVPMAIIAIILASLLWPFLLGIRSKK